MVNLVKGRTINGAVYIDTKKLIINSGAILSPPAQPAGVCKIPAQKLSTGRRCATRSHHEPLLRT